MKKLVILLTLFINQNVGAVLYKVHANVVSRKISQHIYNKTLDFYELIKVKKKMI